MSTRAPPHSPRAGSGRARGRLVGHCLGLGLVLAMTACRRPLVVDVDPTGTKRLALMGEVGQVGELLREVHHRKLRLRAGSKLRVTETWLLREDPAAAPPGYRITGRYDPAQRSEGLALPRGAVRVFFVGVPLSWDDERAGPPPLFPVPREALRFAEAQDDSP